MEDQKENSLLIVFCLLLTFFISYLNYCIGYEWGLQIFYLIPICIVAWYRGLAFAVVLVCFSVFDWLYVNQKIHPYSYFLIPYWNALTRLIVFTMIAALLARLKTMFLLEKSLARQDFLTGAANPKVFYEAIEMEMARSQRFKRSFCIAYIDCDNFKQVNDEMGHLVGDQLIIDIARVMRESTRKTDTVARLGGDEFAILFSETPGDAVKDIILKIHNRLLEVTTAKNWPVTFSIGVIAFATAPATAVEALKRADDLMYSAKKGGKNRIILETSSGTKEEVLSF